MFDIRKGNSAIRDITKGWTALFLNNEANESSKGRMNVTDRVETQIAVGKKKLSKTGPLRFESQGKDQ